MAHIFARRCRGALSSISFSFAAVVVAVALLSGCKPAVKDPNDPNFVVAEKGDWKITRAELNKRVDFILSLNGMKREQRGAHLPQDDWNVLNRMVIDKLLLDKAATLQLKDVDQQEAEDLARIKGPLTDDQFKDVLAKRGMTLDQMKTEEHNQILEQGVLQSEAYKDIEPSEQQVDDIYVKYKDSFIVPPKVRVSRVVLLVDDKTTPEQKAAKKKVIDQARQRVMKGEDFAKVATEVSEDRYSKPRGGDVGFFPKGVSEPGFDDVAFNTKLNQVSPVFLTPLGWEFIKVTDIHAGGSVPMADARKYIAEHLKRAKMQQATTDYTKKLLADSGVIFHLQEPPPLPESTNAAPASAASAPSSPAPDAGSAPPATNAAPQ
jgi:parvulin-like peptidyl-prolyl isomerase